MGHEFDYDVIVIGGGPAGSTVARYAAQENIKVLVIDARASIGSPLQCGELVPTNDEMRRLCPDVPDMDDLFQTPEHAISRTCDTMNIITPSGKSLSYKFEGLILNRVAHDEALVDLAKEAGAEYLVKSFVKVVEQNSVTLRNGKTITAKVIVGAAGHKDPVRRKYWKEKSVNIPAASPTSRWFPLTKRLIVPDIGKEPAPLNVVSPSYLSIKSREYLFSDFPLAKLFCIPMPILAPCAFGNIHA